MLLLFANIAFFIYIHYLIEYVSKILYLFSMSGPRKIIRKSLRQ